MAIDQSLCLVNPFACLTSPLAPAPVCDSVTSMNGTITISWSYEHTGGVALTALKLFYIYSERLNVVNGSETSVAVNSTSEAVTGLEAGREYVFSVIALNSKGSSVAECAPVIHREGECSTCS